MTNFDKMEQNFVAPYRRRVDECGWGIAPTYYWWCSY